MKLKFVLLAILYSYGILSQDLPKNPQTGLISISDSIDIKNKSLQEIKEVISKWGGTLMDLDNLKSIYKLNNSKQTETIAINLPVGSVLTQDKGNNKFITNGTLVYSKVKANGLNAFAPTVTSGGIKFGFSYTITTKKLIYEFTNLEYSHDMLHYGKYEEEKPPSDNYNKSLLLKMTKKEWEAVKKEYFNNLKTLADNLKEYSTNLTQSNQAATHQSPISYDSYKKITTGMSYDEVVKLLADEGKELSNISTQVNGKTVAQQTIIWNDLDRTKSITIIFNDGKVSSKSQTNL